ncbi:MAG: helix-turn-helix domain-containing protein [Clostridiales bacterium]|nr:helix-turn-helix domain-containing protein [Clostridiales bacterium]
MYRVLMVDDEEIALEAMKKGVAWSRLGVSEVFTATNITDARQIIAREGIDILICDIEMPNGSGIDLVSWMKEHSREIICVFLTCHSDFSYAKRAISLGVLDYLLKPVDYDELEEVIEKAIQKKKNEEAFSRAQVVLSDVSKNTAPVQQQENKNQRIIEETKVFIKDNIGQELSRDEVAANVFLNPDYLSRIFKKETGYSVSEYILKMRMSVACELLVKTDLSVSKIAMSCGYSHMAHFSKMFKKDTGMTPNEYRNRYKNRK